MSGSSEVTKLRSGGDVYVVKQPYFTCNLPSKLQSKPYFRTLTIEAYVKQVNLLCFGSDTAQLLDYMSDKCEKLPSSSSSSSKTFFSEGWLCGRETKVLFGNLHLPDSELKRKARQHLRGVVPFGGEVEILPSPSSLTGLSPSPSLVAVKQKRSWSSLLFPWKWFQSTSVVTEIPHAVLIGKDIQGSPLAEWIQKECLKLDVPVYRLLGGAKSDLPQHVSNLAPILSREIKNRLIRTIFLHHQSNLNGDTLKQAYAEGFEKGFQDVQSQLTKRVIEAENKGYQRGIADVKHGLGPTVTLPAKTLPPHLLCSLTKAPMKDPVTTKYGHTFEGSAIREYVRKEGRDPVNHQPLEEVELTPNIACKHFLQFLGTHGVTGLAS